jgi:CheY-like chemotaxis protein
MTQIVEANHKATKILVADDDPAVVGVLAKRLEGIGFDVLTATNGLQALIKAHRSHPDFMIIDVNMPEMDGISVCAELRESAKFPLDVIVITGSADPEIIERCEALRAFYRPKGSDFWKHLVSALTEILPIPNTQLHKLNSGLGLPKLSRVLLVDDDVNVANFLSSRLQKAGAELLYASNATQGYQIACRKKPSVIVSDYFMPNGDGLWLLRRLRKTRVTRAIPFLLLSGRKIEARLLEVLTRDVCGAPGVAQVLEKSLDPEELFNGLSKFCGLTKRW